MSEKKVLKAVQSVHILTLLRDRFSLARHRHPNYDWEAVAKRLHSMPEKLWSLYQMEETGGEPDVVDHDANTGEFIFMDCSSESPNGRRSLCYDRLGWESRKDARPINTAIDLATTMGVSLLNESQYQQLQQLEKVDAKTSSWLLTPPEVRKTGGAIFGDFRYGRVFVYHNGAQSYYASRGFRAVLKV